VWCVGLLWWVQSSRGGGVVCGLDADPSHSGCNQAEISVSWTAWKKSKWYHELFQLQVCKFSKHWQLLVAQLPCKHGWYFHIKAGEIFYLFIHLCASIHLVVVAGQPIRELHFTGRVSVACLWNFLSCRNYWRTSSTSLQTCTSWAASHSRDYDGFCHDSIFKLRWSKVKVKCGFI